MSYLRRVTKLSLSTAAGFRDAGGSLTQGSARPERQLSWELVAAALAAPRQKTRQPVEELARVMVLGECSDGDLARLLAWIGGTDDEARAALVSAIHAETCHQCNGLGKVRGLDKCAACEGTGVKLLSERKTSEMLGVTRHAFRAGVRVAHRGRVNRVLQLQAELEHRLSKAY